jgi:membrane dipeptidase
MRILLIAFLLVCMKATFSQGVRDVISVSRANEIVQQVIKSSPIVDGHNDLFVHYFDCKACPRDLQAYRIDTIARGHTDIPRLRKGGVGAVLMNVFGEDTGLHSYHKAWDLLYRMEATYPDDIKVVGTSKEMRHAMKNGQIAFLPILENAVRLKNDPALLRTFYKLGLRSVTFAYKTNGLADGSDDKPRHNGISDTGCIMVKEMNKIGVLIDMSHISAKAMNDILDISDAPVIFSHSNAKALCDVNRNVPDDVLLRLKKNNGLIMLTFVPYFVKKKHNEWLNAGDVIYYKAEKDFNGRRDSMNIVMDKWEKENPEPLVNIADMADHFDHVKKLIGVDHIGLAGDYDGISFTIKGLENTSTYPNLLLELARRGWTEAELKKISGENFLRVFEAVEKSAALIKQNTK